MLAMGPSFCGRRKSGAFFCNERCVQTWLGSVISQNATQLRFVEHDEVIEAFATFEYVVGGTFQ
jgi:hypothetical protein